MENNNLNQYALTFDIEWAPDFAIEKVARPLIENKIKCTWFVTHLSTYVEELFDYPDIFEFGIHPNFFPGSSHGKTEREVLEYICSLVPNGKVVRTHALYQSTRLLSIMVDEFGIETDCSLFLNLTPNIMPHQIYFKQNSLGMTRIPYFWEDDFCMNEPTQDWNIKSKRYHPYGMKIFNFHPILAYLNCETSNSYEKLKQIRPMNQLREEEVSNFINTNTYDGTGVFYENLIKYILQNKISTHTISELKTFYLNNIQIKFENVI